MFKAEFVLYVVNCCLQSSKDTIYLMWWQRWYRTERVVVFVVAFRHRRAGDFVGKTWQWWDFGTLAGLEDRGWWR